LVLGYLLSLNSPLYAAESYAIFSLNSEFETLSINKARKLYRGKTRLLQGERVELSDWPETSTERTEFYRYLLNKNLAQMNAHWASLSFSGKARPPKVIEEPNVDALLTWMKEQPNRIGYAPIHVLPSSARILYVVSSEK
jgi:site-specific recombinase XerD